MPVSPPSAAMASPLKAFSATLVAVLFSLVVLSLPLSHAGHSKHAPHKPHKPHAPHARHVPHAPHAPHARHAPHAPHKAHDRMLGGHNPWKPRNDGGKKKPAPKNPPHPVPAPQPSVAAPGWKLAHATFYEGGSGTFGGACGYDDVVQKGYGLETAALSSVMFNNGATCGACYEIQCINSPQWCKPGKPTLTLTATNLCPPNWGLPSDNGGWCNPPREHFDIAIPVFTKIAEHKAGIVPVQYRRVPCKKQGGVRFTITGNPYFNMVLVWNVGGAGDVTCVDIKGEKTNWIPMTRNWGQKWHSGCKLTGQKLSFRVKTSDGKCVTSMNVAPANWQFGQTFEGQNFDCK